MVSEKVSGVVRPPLCGDSASEVPRDQWPTLIEERQRFCRSILPRDCRMLLFFVEDASKSDWMGYGSRVAYLRDALRLDPRVVELAAKVLELTGGAAHRPDA